MLLLLSFRQISKITILVEKKKSEGGGKN